MLSTSDIHHMAKTLKWAHWATNHNFQIAQNKSINKVKIQNIIQWEQKWLYKHINTEQKQVEDKELPK